MLRVVQNCGRLPASSGRVMLLCTAMYMDLRGVIKSVFAFGPLALSLSVL